MNVLNIGDKFLISKNSINDCLKKLRSDVNNIQLTLDFFKEKNIDFFYAEVVENKNGVTFKQEFFDVNKNKIDFNGKFNDEFVLHLDHICDKVESQYSSKNATIEDPIEVNGVNFKDGDLYFFPLNNLNEYDKNLFSEEFNEAVDNAKINNLKNIVFSVNYNSPERENAGDDLSAIYNNKNTDEFDYSEFNIASVPVIRMFFTDNFGNVHFSLRELNNKNVEKTFGHKDDMLNNLFFSEKIMKEYNANILNFISTLKENTLSLFLNIKNVKENLKLIGNYQSKEYNYIGLYDMRNHFKEYQKKQLTILSDIKTIMINKEDLSLEEREKLNENSTHLMIMIDKNENNHSYLNINVKELTLKNGEYSDNRIKRKLSAYSLNKILESSKNIKILKRKGIIEEIETPLFEYNTHRQIDPKKSEISEKIEKGNAYLIGLKHFKHYVHLEENEKRKELENLEKLGIKELIVHFSTPYHFLFSDEEFENNKLVYIERERFIETKAYPLIGKERKFVDLNILNNIESEEEKIIFLEKLENSEIIENNLNDINHEKLIAMKHLKLETEDTLRFINSEYQHLHLIEKRKNPYFSKANVLNDYVLHILSQLSRDVILNNEENIKVSKVKFKR